MKFSRLALATIVTALASTTALAHTGHEHAASFATGFVHPWSGLDHLLAMVAVGLWAGINGGRALWAWPVTFASVMVAGGALAMGGARVPAVEPGILASVIVLGLLALGAIRLPVAAGIALVAVFALLHGYAHGAELPLEVAGVTYALGFALATALLHAVGLGVACLSTGERGLSLARGAGALVAVSGVVLAFI
ncbi:MAG: HupE/UreJ family protein [Hyphomicrobiaceae bacterium]|nr:MAG: HupE/UreJ family protein [Hyphomicrobiaceae bacterium]